VQSNRSVTLYQTPRSKIQENCSFNSLSRGSQMSTLKIFLRFIGFEVLKAAIMKNTVFRELAPCGSCTKIRFGGFLYPEEGGYMFLRNVGSYKAHRAPHCRRRPSSTSLNFVPKSFLNCLMRLLFGPFFLPLNY
jgi:hypothetical protein